MKLSPERRRAILDEMVLAELFSEKAWCRRYQISARTVKRLRAEARELLARQLAAQNGPFNVVVMALNNSGNNARKRA